MIELFRMPIGYSIGLIAFAHSIICGTEKNSSNDVAMAIIAYASGSIQAKCWKQQQQEQQQQVNNRSS